MIGQQIENYRILSKLGEGAMGVVYKAVDVNLERVVAMKLMNAGLSHHPDLEARFRSEARTQATLNHQNIATLYSFLTWEGKAVMVMEYVDGKTLQQMVTERGALPPATALALCKQALYGVGAAHRQNIVHRDLKPANLMLSNDGVIKVMDFGIAKIKGGAGLKGTSMAIGTYDYMAPEQALNKQVDGRSDIYSMGITLYELLTGDVPFKGDSELAVQIAHLNDRPRDPRETNPAVPEAVAQVVLRAIEKNPEDRFATTEEFIRALPRLSDASGQIARQTPPGHGTVIDRGIDRGIDTAGGGGTPVASGAFQAPSWPPSRPPVDAGAGATQVLPPNPGGQSAGFAASVVAAATAPVRFPTGGPGMVTPAQEVRPAKKSNAGALLGGVVAVVVAIALVAGWFVFAGKKENHGSVQPTPIPAPTPGPAPGPGPGPTPTPPPTVSLTMSPAQVQLDPGKAQKFAAIISGSPTAQKAGVRWMISPVGLGSIDKNGMYVAPHTVASNETVSVIATSVASPTQSVTSTVTLMASAAPPPPPPPSQPSENLVGEWEGLYQDGNTQEKTPVKVDITSEGSDERLSGKANFTLDSQTTTCSVAGSRYDPATRELHLSYTSCKGTKRAYLNLPTTFKGVDPAAKMVTGGTVMNQPGVTVALVKHGS